MRVVTGLEIGEGPMDSLTDFYRTTRHVGLHRAVEIVEVELQK
jgi:hypothetical protein